LLSEVFNHAQHHDENYQQEEGGVQVYEFDEPDYVVVLAEEEHGLPPGEDELRLEKEEEAEEGAREEGDGEEAPVSEGVGEHGEEQAGGEGAEEEGKGGGKSEGQVGEV
jgi:hypothetical protein